LFVFHKIIFNVSSYYQVHIYRCNQWYSTAVIINWSTAKKHSFLQWQWMCSLLNIAIRFTVTIYSYLKWQRILYLLRRIFSFLYHRQDFYRTWLYIWVTQWVSHRKQELLTLHEHPSQLQFLVGPVLFIFLVFCVVILLCLSPFCVLSQGCFVYGLSMFDFPFTFF
jgi:hypothetical protein